MNRITSRQIRALWGYADWFKISAEDLREWVFVRTGKTSIRALSRGEASELIDEIVLKWEKKSASSGADRMTTAQARRLALLEDAIGWNERRALGLARKMYHLEDLHLLDRKKASGLIEALKAIGRKNSRRPAA